MILTGSTYAALERHHHHLSTLQQPTGDISLHVAPSTVSAYTGLSRYSVAVSALYAWRRSYRKSLRALATGLSHPACTHNAPMHGLVPCGGLSHPSMNGRMEARSECLRSDACRRLASDLAPTHGLVKEAVVRPARAALVPDHGISTKPFVDHEGLVKWTLSGRGGRHANRYPYTHTPLYAAYAAAMRSIYTMRRIRYPTALIRFQWVSQCL
jgi:hypothetical protein